MESQVVSSADFVPNKDGTQCIKENMDELISNGTTDTEYDEGVLCNNMRCSEKSEQVRKNTFTYMRPSNRFTFEKLKEGIYLITLTN